MLKSCARWLIFLVALLAGGEQLPAAEVDYAREVKPLLKQRCYACHGALKQQAGLRLDTGAGIRLGGGSGAAVNPADAGQSLLLKVVSGEAIIGAHIFRDLFAGITNIIGGRAGGYEKALREARDLALGDMQDEAQRLGADAIVGVDLDYESVFTTLTLQVQQAH